MPRRSLQQPGHATELVQQSSKQASTHAHNNLASRKKPRENQNKHKAHARPPLFAARTPDALAHSAHVVHTRVLEGCRRRGRSMQFDDRMATAWCVLLQDTKRPPTIGRYHKVHHWCCIHNGSGHAHFLPGRRTACSRDGSTTTCLARLLEYVHVFCNIAQCTLQALACWYNRQLQAESAGGVYTNVR